MLSSVCLWEILVFPADSSSSPGSLLLYFLPYYLIFPPSLQNFLHLILELQRGRYQTFICCCASSRSSLARASCVVLCWFDTFSVDMIKG